MFLRKIYKQAVFLIGLLSVSSALVGASWLGSLWQGSKKVVATVSQTVAPDEGYDALTVIRSAEVNLKDADQYKEQEAEMIVAVADLKKWYPDTSSLLQSQLIELLKSVDDETGNTIAHYAAEKISPSLINFLVEKGLVALFFQKNNQQKIPFVLLMEAFGKLEFLRLQLGGDYFKDSENSLYSIVSTIGVDEFSKHVDENKKTLLYRAIGIGSLELVKILLKVGVKPWILQRHNPLALALKKEHVDIIKLLLETDLAKDLIITVDNTEEKTPFEIAMEKKKFEIGYLFLKKEGVLESIVAKMYELPKNQTDLPKKQLTRSISWDDLLQHGFSTQEEYSQFLKNIGLHYLNDPAKKDVVEKLKVAKIIYFGVDADGSSALFTAVQDNDLEQVKKILPHCSVDVIVTLNNATDLPSEIQGLSPLHLAAYNNSVEILKVLLNKEGVIAVSGVKNSHGENFMHLLVKNFYKNVTDTSMDAKQFFTEKAYNFLSNQAIQDNFFQGKDVNNFVNKTLNADEVNGVQQSMFEYLQALEAKIKE